MSIKRTSFDSAALAASMRSLAAPSRADEGLPPEPVGAWVRGDLSAHIELSSEAAERFADAMLGDDGPTPEALALFARYGRG
jgi:hypothetical protein